MACGLGRHNRNGEEAAEWPLLAAPEGLGGLWQGARDVPDLEAAFSRAFLAVIELFHKSPYMKR